MMVVSVSMSMRSGLGQSALLLLLLMMTMRLVLLVVVVVVLTDRDWLRRGGGHLNTGRRAGGLAAVMMVVTVMAVMAMLWPSWCWHQRVAIDEDGGGGVRSDGQLRGERRRWQQRRLRSSSSARHWAQLVTGSRWPLVGS